MRACCSNCLKWMPCLGYSLGTCLLLSPSGRNRNENGEIIRSVCTKGDEQHACHQPAPRSQNIYYGD